MNAAPIGRTAAVGIVQGLKRQDGPSFFFPTHVRAVLNAPGQHWKPAYDTDLPPAYVAVYPVSGLLRQYPERGPGSVRGLIDTLRALNSGRLKLNELKGELPFLPPRNAFQVTAGSARKFDTSALKGIRYLTLYSQESGVRFPREAVLYTFQGLSHDGRFYMTVQVPYNPTGLPTLAERERTKNDQVAPYPAKSSGPGYDAYQEKWRAYLRDLTRKLNAEDTSAKMRALDAVVQSLKLR